MRKRSLRSELLISNLFLLLIPLLSIIFLVTTYFSQIILKGKENSNHYIAQTVAMQVNNKIKSINSVSHFIISNSSLREFMLLPEDVAPVVYFQNYTKAFEEIRNLLYDDSSIQDIFLYEDDTHSIHCGIQTTVSFTNTEMDMMDDSIGGWFWSISNDQLSMCRMIRNIYNVNERVAYLKIIIDKNDFLTFFSQPNMTDDIYFAMSDEFGNILIDNLPDDYVWLLDNFKNMDVILSNSDSYYQCSDSPEFQSFPIDLTKNHTVIAAFSKDYARQYRQIIILILVSLVVLFTVIALIQYSFYNRFVLRPIIGLSYMMEQIEQNQFSGRFEKETVKELQPVISKFNNMSKKLEYLYTEVYRNNLQLKDAQIRSLQKEINPHFLYNTLDSIRWMIELKQVDNASRMVQLLSSLFRFSIGQMNPDGLVTLKSELDHVNYYVGIEQLRHQNSFEFTIDLEDEIAHSLDHIQVIKLILQPFIENAIKYGVSKIVDGEILLVIYLENNQTTEEQDLIYYIYNNGPSVDPDEIHKILNQPEDDSIDEKNTRGFALRNVNSRIQLKYGKRYGVTCYAPSNGGSVFIIKQPLVIREKN